MPKQNAKVIRGSYTMPPDDHELIEKLKTKCLNLGIVMNKGEILRAGLHALNRLSPSEVKVVAETVEKVKTGRPA